MNILKNSWRKGIKLLSQLLCIGAVFTACTDDEVVNQTDKAPLQVSVNTSLAKQSRAIVHGEWLPSGSIIGVSLFDTEGDDYDGQGYYNIQYKATGAEEDQTWSSMGVTPTISANEAVLVAYHPYNDDEDIDIFAMPVEIASQTDYMYSGPVTGITNASPKADIVLDHALTSIRVKLVLGDFTGDASVSEIAVASPALASSATLNAVDGSLDNIAGQGDKFTLPVDFDLVAGGTDNDIMFVPDASVVSGVTIVSATIGGKKYTAGIEFDEAYKQGYIYTYTLTLNNSGFAVTKVNVNPWEQGNDDEAELKFTFDDDEYVIKINACYEDNGGAQPTSLLSTRAVSTFTFYHNLVDFIGTIDWGDGTVDTYTEPVEWPTHVYPNDSKSYIISAKAKEGFLWQPNNDSFAICLTELLHLGNKCELDIESFSYCINLKHISPDFFDVDNLPTSFSSMFAYCSSLTSIPEGLFDNCTKVTDFNSAFSGCKSLQVIPEGLFDHCTKVTDFSQTFSGTGITEIPSGLFDKCTEVTSFSGAFGYTDIVEIPVGLFDYNTKVTNFEATFKSTNITNIPEGLFDNCPEVTNFKYAFEGCSSLQTIPKGLFDKCTEVTDFGSTFADCTSLNVIPNGLFDNNIKVTNFGGAFSYCTSLQAIPKGLFDKCTEVTNFGGTFRVCENLTTIPEGLFDSCTEVTHFDETFSGCKNLRAIPEGLFRYNTQVNSYNAVFNNCISLKVIPSYTFCSTAQNVIFKSNYSSAFNGCKSLTTIKSNAFICPNLNNMDEMFNYLSALSVIEKDAFDCPNVTSMQETFANTDIEEIPEGLFDKCTKVTDFSEAFFGCKKLQTIPEGLFDKCTEVTSFARTFYWCEKLQNIPVGLFDKCPEVTSFAGTFYGCSSLTSIPTGLFDNNTKVKQFGYNYPTVGGTFGACRNLTGESPYTVINVNGVDTKVHLYERSNYPVYFTAPNVSRYCFENCTGLTDYDNIPSSWK